MSNPSHGGSRGSHLSGKSSHSRKHADIQQAVPIIENKLYFLATKYRPKSNENVHFFTIDNVLRYEPFFVDFGPLNLACLYKFCGLLKHKLKDQRYAQSRIYYYCDKDPQRIANASYLIGAFQIIELSRHPSVAFSVVHPIARKSMPFRDASMGICTYKCSVEHCLWAIYRALQRKYLNFNSFNVDEYQHYERVECGDLNIIVPNKFVAFAGPHYKDFDDEGYPALTPQFYLPIWKKFGVTTIIRLNKKCYDKRVWTNQGYEHFDLYFTDGTTPNDSIIQKFLEICENASGVVAVHCKAGLGRTGSLLGCYFMKHYCWKAFECIAWLRICRPGSVIGPQQQFLEKQQPIMWREGDAFRKKHGIKLEIDPRIEEAQMKAEKQKVKEFGQRFVDSQHQMSSNSNSNNKNKSKNGSSSNSNSNINNNNNNVQEEKKDNRGPLATDPGQNQGGALINAKRHHKHDNIPKHLFTPENSGSDLMGSASNINHSMNSNGKNNSRNGYAHGHNRSSSHHSHSHSGHSGGHGHVHHSNHHHHGQQYRNGAQYQHQYEMHPQGQQQNYQYIHGNGMNYQTQSQSQSQTSHHSHSHSNSHSYSHAQSKSKQTRSQSSTTPNRSSKQFSNKNGINIDNDNNVETKKQNSLSKIFGYVVGIARSPK